MPAGPLGPIRTGEGLAMSLRGKRFCKDCRKESYPTQRDASRRAARWSASKVAYPCPTGHGWHFGEDYGQA